MNSQLITSILIGQVPCPSRAVRRSSNVHAGADGLSVQGNQTAFGHGIETRACAITQATAEGTWTYTPKFGMNHHSQRWRMVT